MNNSVAVNWLKRLVRSKYIYVWLLVLLVLYLILNGYVSQKALFNTEIDRNPNNELNDPDQLSKLKERIKVLEESLESSKRNAQELNVLIRNVYKDLNDTLTLNEKLRGMAQEDSKDTSQEPKIAILVISCNRAKSVENHLKQLIKHREKSTHGREKFPIIVSQDCGHTETADMISSFSSSLFASIKVYLLWLCYSYIQYRIVFFLSHYYVNSCFFLLRQRISRSLFVVLDYVIYKHSDIFFH